MKHLATLALMLHLAVAGVYAQPRPVKMTFSGTGAASPIDLKHPNTSTTEENVAGYGTLGCQRALVEEDGSDAGAGGEDDRSAEEIPPADSGPLLVVGFMRFERLLGILHKAS